MDYSRNFLGLDLPNWKEAKNHEDEICSELLERLKVQKIIVFKSVSRDGISVKHPKTIQFCKELVNGFYPELKGLENVRTLAIMIVKDSSFFKIKRQGFSVTCCREELPPLIGNFIFSIFCL